jgi:GNAT superfamily N-acetyltransferase
VHPTQRGKGYGQLLMEAAETHGRSLGWDEILLGIYQTKTGLINYYAKQGYALTGELKELSLAAEVPEKLPLLVMLSKPLVG